MFFLEADNSMFCKACVYSCGTPTALPSVCREGNADYITGCRTTRYRQISPAACVVCSLSHAAYTFRNETWPLKLSSVIFLGKVPRNSVVCFLWNFVPFFSVNMSFMAEQHMCFLGCYQI